MGLRELLILILILAIVAVVLRGLYVALRSRRGQIKIALEKNIPEYDLEELEMRELPNGGARMVERSFAEVLRQNSAHAAKANATATGKPSTLRPGAKGLKTNLSRSAARTAPVSAAAIKSEPALGLDSADELPLFAGREAEPAASIEKADETSSENIFTDNREEQDQVRAAEQDFVRDFDQDLEQDLERELQRDLERDLEQDLDQALEQDLDQALEQESAQAEEPILLAEEPAYQADDTEEAESDIDEIFAEEGFSVDGPISGDDGLDAAQGSTEAPRYEDQDDPASYERSLAEEEEALFDEEPLINVGDGNFNEEMLSESEEARSEPDADWLDDNNSDMDEQETGDAVFNATVDDHDGFNDDINDDDTDDDDMDEVIEEEELAATRRLREDEELDDVLDELLQPSPTTPRYESAQQPEPEPEYEPDPEPEPEYEPEPEPEPEYEPSRQPDTDPEPQPTYDPEPPPHYDPEPEPATRFDDDPLLDYSADDLEEGDTRVTGQTTAQPEDFVDPLEDAESDSENEYDEQQDDSQSDPQAVEDDMPDFDNEYIADPEPQPAENDSFGANRDEEMDVLFDDDDRERRIAALEEQQDSASRRFMSWAGGAFSRLGAGVAASKARAAEDAAERNEQKARKKQAQAEEREARQELNDVASSQHETDLTDDYFDDEDGVSSVREQERPGAAERRRAEQLRQSQLDLDVDDGYTDDGYDEGEQATEADTRNQEPPAYSEVLVVNVMARPGTEMMGEDLLPVLMSNGLRFGEMSIFHRHTDKFGGRKNGPVMFSVANALNPGTFDLNKISEFSTQGVCFFMTLPNVVNNMIAFEQMLATARNVQAALDAELKDDNRSVMTAQTVEHYRQRIRDFELQELKNAHAR